MKNFMNKLADKANKLYIRTNCAIHSAEKVLADKTGDLTTNTLGGIILGIIFIGLLVLAVNTIFPGVIQRLFSSMSTKLTGYMGTSTTGGSAGTFTAIGG